MEFYLMEFHFRFRLQTALMEFRRPCNPLVQADENCLANVVVEHDASSTADEWLSATLKELLRVGSPNEHLLQECCEHEELPDVAAKHLLGVKHAGTRKVFTTLLRKFANVAPA